MKFQMEQHHIALGQRYVCGSCPVALVLNETTGKAGWRVGTWEILHESAHTTIRTPENVANFIVSFDEGKRVAPISFELPDDLVNKIVAEVSA